MSHECLFPKSIPKHKQKSRSVFVLVFFLSDLKGGCKFTVDSCNQKRNTERVTTRTFGLFKVRLFGQCKAPFCSPDFFCHFRLWWSQWIWVACSTLWLTHLYGAGRTEKQLKEAVPLGWADSEPPCGSGARTCPLCRTVMLLQRQRQRQRQRRLFHRRSRVCVAGTEENQL